MDEKQQALLDAALAECEKLKREGKHLDLWLDVSQAMTLIALLQLALRHPGNRGHSARVGRQLVNLLSQSLCGPGPLRQLLALGDDPSADVPRERPAAPADGRPVIVALVGPPLSLPVWGLAAAQEELRGRLVLRPAVLPDSSQAGWTNDERQRLEDLATARIHAADEVLILDVSELRPGIAGSIEELARAIGRRVRRWSEESSPSPPATGGCADTVPGGSDGPLGE